jgi:hypothetical protein
MGLLHGPTSDWPFACFAAVDQDLFVDSSARFVLADDPDAPEVQRLLFP